MMPRSAEWLVRLLVFVGGVASTIVGSWVSSKIRVYHDNWKAHLSDIQQKVLIPIHDSLIENYTELLGHKSPAVDVVWGVRDRRENAKVTEHQNEEGPLLRAISPDVRIVADQTLYADTKKKHFPKLISNAEQFSDAWCSHAQECRAWVLKMAEEILSKGNLPPFPGSDTHVRHYSLGVFIYRRLFRTLDYSLFTRNQGSNWVLEGFDGATAVGTKQELDNLLCELDAIREREKATAERLLSQAQDLQRRLISLCGEFNYAIAARRLRHKCDLVPFF